MIANNPGDVVVQSSRKIESVGWFRPIAKHHRHGGKHLHGNAVAIALLNTALRVPDVVSDFAENTVANHHPRAAWLIVLEPDKAAIAVFRVQIRPIAWENVGVDVDLHDVVAPAVSAEL